MRGAHDLAKTLNRPCSELRVRHRRGRSAGHQPLAERLHLGEHRPHVEQLLIVQVFVVERLQLGMVCEELLERGRAGAPAVAQIDKPRVLARTEDLTAPRPSAVMRAGPESVARFAPALPRRPIARSHSLASRCTLGMSPRGWQARFEANGRSASRSGIKMPLAHGLVLIRVHHAESWAFRDRLSRMRFR